MSTHRSSTQIPVIFCTDVEPTEFYVNRDNPKAWTGFEFTHDYLKTFRSKCEEITQRPVHLNWFLRLDPQVAIGYGSATWVADQYLGYLDEYRSLGDDLGIHVHTYRWSKSRNTWIDDCGNPEWVYECLQGSAENFQRVFGEPARSLRFGNFWLSTRGINEAESLGLKYDLSVEPGREAIFSTPGKPPQSGPTPDCRRVPRIPYRPSRSNFRRPDSSVNHRNFHMIPMTSAYIDPGWGIKGIRHRLGRIRHNGFQGRLQYKPLSMWAKWEGRNDFNTMIDRALKVQKRPYLAFAIRSDIDGKLFQIFDSCMRALLNHPANSRFIFTTPEKMMKLESWNQR